MTQDYKPDFRALCAELLAAIQLYTKLNPAAYEMSASELTGKLMDAMAATTAALSQPEPQGPVPVAERLPGPEDCDAELCWIWNPETLWWELLSLRMIRLNAGDPYTHWLPHHALPVPTPANTTNQED
jgi:hypothetical protein